MLMGRNLKNSFVFATLAFLTACQTPQASNQQDRPARTGQSSSPSSQYEVEPISGIQRPLGAPGTFQPGSGRGPGQVRAKPQPMQRVTRARESQETRLELGLRLSSGFQRA